MYYILQFASEEQNQSILDQAETLEVAKAKMNIFAHDYAEEYGIPFDSESNFPFSVYRKMGYGWFIYISDDMDDQCSIPLDLAACVTAAKNAGCRILCLDSDGPIEKSLLSCPCKTAF